MDDAKLEPRLLSFALELTEETAWPDGSTFSPDVAEAVFGPNPPPPALSLARVYAHLSGADLRRQLAQRRALLLDAETPVTNAVAGLFDNWARLLRAFAAPDPKVVAEPRQVTISQRPNVRVRDTIFDKYGPSGEKTGGLDLSAGQPTSTAQYVPQVPKKFDKPVNEEATALAQRLAAAGYGFDDEELQALQTRALLGDAPPAAPAQKVRVAYPDDGKVKHANVYISRPATLAANAPQVLRLAADDSGPEVPLSAHPPADEV